MSGTRLTSSVLFLASLTLTLLLSCGERAGDPVVALPGTQAAEGGEPPSATGGAGPSGGAGNTAGTLSTGGSANAAGSPPAAGGGSAGEAGSGATPSVGPSGLCAPCASSSECGDANDACILHDDERFCGRDCDGPQDCPDGYSCVELSNSQLLQCVPDTSCVAPSVPPTLEDGRRYVLTRINAERAAASLDALDASECLDEIAQQSALDFARTDEPLGKYVKECDPVWPNCACGWWAQGEVTVARYGLDWQTAVDAALSASTVGGERFAQAYLSTAVTDVGIGFWLSGDEAWIALSFR